MAHDVREWNAAERAASVTGDGFVRSTARDLPVDVTGPDFDRFRATWEDLRLDGDLGIPMWRESERHFAPLDPRTLADPCLRTLVACDLTVAGLVRDHREWTVGLHAIRVVARTGESGLPTPEGVHRDGHSFVGMHLIRRENSSGGESRVHRAGRPDVVFTLESPLDSVLVDDTAVWHAASPISVRDPAAGRTVRDMLLVDINPA